MRTDLLEILGEFRNRIEKIANEAEKLELTRIHFILLCFAEALAEGKVLGFSRLVKFYWYKEFLPWGKDRPPYYTYLATIIDDASAEANMLGLRAVGACLRGIAVAVMEQNDFDLYHNCGAFLRINRAQKYESYKERILVASWVPWHKRLYRRAINNVSGIFIPQMTVSQRRRRI